MTDLESLIRSALDGTFRTFTQDGTFQTIPVRRNYIPDYNAARMCSVKMAGYRNTPRVLTPEEAEKARALRKSGDSVATIAMALGCGQRAVWPAVRSIKFKRRTPQRRIFVPVDKPRIPGTFPPVAAERDVLNLASEAMAGISLAEIKSAVSNACGVPLDGMDSHLRYEQYVCARQVFYWLARHIKRTSLAEIGRRCGGRDHATVDHGIKKINAQRERFAAIIERACANLGIPVPGVAA